MHLHQAVVHQFRASLERSISIRNECDWAAFYRTVWPNAVSIHRIDGPCREQFEGVDRIVYLPKGKVTIDEKIRERDFGDILIEIWSVWRDGKGIKPGWAVDGSKVHDYIAYAIPTASKCYLIPRELLRLTTVKFHSQWGNWIDAKNVGYITRNKAVQWGVLCQCMEKTMQRQWGGVVLNEIHRDGPLQLDLVLDGQQSER